MDVIPVMDLKGGVVVHARRGRRDEYRPIVTPLAASAAPGDVLAGLLQLHPFRRLYVADLDAIEGRGDHAAALASLARAFPQVEIWLDCGARDAAGVARALACGAGVVVLGTESLPDAAAWRTLRAERRLALSLDFRGEAFQGPPELLRDASLWPERIIVMTLARVGAGTGPDWERLGEVLARAGRRAVHAAGGVRNAKDLRRLARLGAAGALVATALHEGAIGAAELAEIAGDGRA